MVDKQNNEDGMAPPGLPVSRRLVDTGIRRHHNWMATRHMSQVHDPYGDCESGCTHDLVRGVLVADLKHDGPYPAALPTLLIGSGWLSARIEAAVEQQTSRVQT